jgi:hypothetical protein
MPSWSWWKPADDCHVCSLTFIDGHAYAGARHQGELIAKTANKRIA